MAEGGCGRRLTGQCIGWHNISEEEYQRKLKERQEKAAEEKRRPSRPLGTLLSAII